MKFAGCYHGHVDALLASAGSGVATLGLPDSAGVSAAVTGETIVVPYNDVEAVEAAFAEHGDRIAAVITEAAPANMGVVPPLPGFNAALRRLTLTHGALLIQDEVLTGFRVGYSGWWGLEGLREGWAADLHTFGKVIGGGLPVAAVGGRRDVMACWPPTGPVYQAGTLSGNPVATAAGLATLRLADASVYARVDAVSAQLRGELTAALSAEGLPHAVQWAGNLFSTFFGADAAAHGARDYAAVLATESWRYAPFFTSLLESGRVRAAVAVRGVVRVGRARRRRGGPDRLGPPGRRPRRRAGHGTDRLTHRRRDPPRGGSLRRSSRRFSRPFGLRRPPRRRRRPR